MDDMTENKTPIKPYYDEGGITIYHGDCLNIAPRLGKFDLVLTDPPYGKVKGDFDKEWTNRPAMLKDCELWADMCAAAMKSNGTLWWFAWPSLAGRIEALISQRLNPLAHCLWVKPCPTAQRHCPERLRAPAPETERVLMFEHYGADNMALGESGYVAKCDELRGFVFEPLRAYLAGEWANAGLTKKDAEVATGTQMSSHWFTNSQWTLPTSVNYAKLQARANQGNADVHLRREYEDLRRYFELGPGDPKTEIWKFSPEPRSALLGHPTQKPLSLISFMARISCRPGGRVLDPFGGSGTTARAAKDLGLDCVLIDKNERFCEISAKSLSQEAFSFG